MAWQGAVPSGGIGYNRKLRLSIVAMAALSCSPAVGTTGQRTSPCIWAGYGVGSGPSTGVAGQLGADARRPDSQPDRPAGLGVSIGKTRLGVGHETRDGVTHDASPDQRMNRSGVRDRLARGGLNAAASSSARLAAGSRHRKNVLPPFPLRAPVHLCCELRLPQPEEGNEQERTEGTEKGERWQAKTHHVT